MATNIHHYWWPKRKFSTKNLRSVRLEIPIELHEAYHEHFLNNCRRVENRKCPCKFDSVCCYSGTTDTF